MGNNNAGNPSAWTYVPDDSVKGLYSLTQESVNLRLTWQANPKNKFSGFYDNQWRCWCKRTLTSISPESASTYNFPIENMASFSWSSPLTSRLLVDASLSTSGERFAVQKPAVGDPFRTLIPVTEQSTGLLYRGVGTAVATQPFIANTTSPSNAQASLTFVTGTHALKFGFNDTWGGRHATYDSPADVGLTYRFNTVGGVTTPNLITEYATPYSNSENLRANLGIFAQDKWTRKRLTLNLGVRFDYFNDYFPESSLGPGPLVPTRNLTFPEADFVSWKDLSPRLGAAYDLFGNGKTAVKVSLNKYMVAQGLQGTYGDQADPIGRLPNMITRSWNDFFFPAGDLAARQLRARLLADRPARQQRMRDHVEYGLRRHRPRDDVQPQGADGVGRSSRQLGVLDQRPARALPARVGERRLLPPVVRQLHGHRQPVGRSRRLQSVHRSPRRRIRGCPAAAAI